MNQADTYQHIQDENHIRLLSIFHCVYGGLATLVGVGLIILAIIMINVMSSVWSMAGSSAAWATTGSSFATTGATGGVSWATTGTGTPATYSTTGSTTYSTTGSSHVTTSSYSGSSPAEIAGFLETFMNIYFSAYALMGLVSLVIGILCFVSAHKMKHRRGQTFSLIVAGINCLSIPLGTTLGVFTFIVLLRPSVSTVYRHNAATHPGSSQ